MRRQASSARRNKVSTSSGERVRMGVPGTRARTRLQGRPSTGASMRTSTRIGSTISIRPSGPDLAAGSGLGGHC